MDIAIDASSVINLDNVGALSLVASLNNCKLWVSPLVAGECEPACAARLAQLHQEGLIEFVDHDQIPAEMYLNLLAENELGEGETECIALCLVGGQTFCCDDLRARQVATEKIGTDRVIGSLRLLRWCVVEKLIDADAAYEFYMSMKAAGGFLPDLTLEFFSATEY